MILSGDLFSLPPNGQVKNELLNASPYLSDEIMIAALEDKPTPLPPGHVQQVIVANSPVTDPVYDAVLNRNLPNGIMKNIDNAQLGVSEREKAERRIIWYEAQVQTLENTKVNYYIKSDDMATAKSLLAMSTYPEQHKRLAEIYLYENDFAAVINTLDDIIGYSDESNMSNNLAYVELMELQAELYQAGSDFYNMDEEQEQIVRDIAETDGSTALSAQMILFLVYDEEFQHCTILKLDTGNTKRMIFENSESNSTPIEVLVPFAKLYPNPNNGNMELQYYFDKGQDGNIAIFDNVGRKVIQYDLDAGKNHLNISNDKLENGIYVYKITSGGKTIVEEKLIIIK
ncbi:MAG: T9SS type A sorting domain-containing protein [Bacteroidota bacterium]